MAGWMAGCCVHVFDVFANFYDPCASLSLSLALSRMAKIGSARPLVSITPAFYCGASGRDGPTQRTLMPAVGLDCFDLEHRCVHARASSLLAKLMLMCFLHMNREYDTLI